MVLPLHSTVFDTTLLCCEICTWFMNVDCSLFCTSAEFDELKVELIFRVGCTRYTFLKDLQKQKQSKQSRKDRFSIIIN